MILQTIENKLDELFSIINGISRQQRQFGRRLDRIQSSHATSDADPLVNYDFNLSHSPSVMPLIITQRVFTHEDAAPGSPSSSGNKMFYWKARRMEVLPSEPPTLNPNKWEADPDFDLQDYIVMATPGNTGFFPGCRFWGILSHETEFRNSSGVTLYQGEVVVPLSGEHLGIEVELNGAGTNPTGVSGLKFYNWTQFFCGLSQEDSRVSGQEIAGVGGAPDFTLPVALQLESASFDSDISSYIGIPVGTKAFLHYVNFPRYTGAPDAGYFVFNHATHPDSEEC